MALILTGVCAVGGVGGRAAGAGQGPGALQRRQLRRRDRRGSRRPRTRSGPMPRPWSSRRSHLERYRQSADADGPRRGARGARRRAGGGADAARPGRSDHRARPVAVSRRDLRRRGGAVRHRAEPCRRCLHRATGCCCSTGGRRRSIAKRRPARPIVARASSNASPRAWTRSFSATRAAPSPTTGWPWRARGAGDIEGAWSAAVAAWVRSTLSPETTSRLRDDLDRLVTQALIPERSRTRGRPRAAGSGGGLEPSGSWSSSSGSEPGTPFSAWRRASSRRCRRRR